MTNVTIGSITLVPREPNGVTPIHPKKFVRIPIIGSDSDQLQNLGMRTKSWRITGEDWSTDASTNKSTIEGYLTNNTEVSFVYDGTRNVFVESATFIENVRGFAFNIVVVVSGT